MTASLLQDAVLVTGAGRRVGLHLAERMMALGHPVVAHYRTHTEGVERLRAAGAVCLQGDLADPDGGPRLAAAVGAGAGRLGGGVPNAPAFEGAAAGTPGGAAAPHGAAAAAEGEEGELADRGSDAGGGAGKMATAGMGQDRRGLRGVVPGGEQRALGRG
ncbi:hypothetical protein GAY30_27910, partial [Azospirillum brasilense]|uniref:hypothetical protein n=1 Tax=Azospirillum brasilense TaxID=192 RepID=UPI003CE4E28E|nr:hypothetical protein [Azospirillum brasilense]